MRLAFRPHDGKGKLIVGEAFLGNVQVFPLYEGIRKVVYWVGFTLGYEERRIMDEAFGIGAFGVRFLSRQPYRADNGGCCGRRVGDALFFGKLPYQVFPFLCLLAFPFDSFRRLWDNAGCFIIRKGVVQVKERKPFKLKRREEQGTFGRRSGGCGLPLRRRRCHLTVPSGFRELLVNLHPLKISFPLGFTRIFGLEAVGDLFLGGIVVQQVRGNPDPNVINSPAPHDIGG